MWSNDAGYIAGCDDSNSRENNLYLPPRRIIAENHSSAVAEVNQSQTPNRGVVCDNEAMAMDVMFKTDVLADMKSADVWKELCVICGDRASGFHYNAFSCEGCKGFFRRSIMRNASYECKYGGNCEMDMWMRRRCQFCRLRRCREVGMREECLLSEGQCKVRDARRKAKLRGQGKLSRSRSPSSSISSLHLASISAMTSSSAPQVDRVKVEELLENLTKEQKDMIERLVTYQDQYEVPSEESIASLTSMRTNEDVSTDPSDVIFRRMAEMTILVTQLVVEFAKRLPGFLDLERDDQIILLKGSASEVMMLRTARRYDPRSDTVVFGDGTPFTRDSLRFGGLQDYTEEMFEFAQKMAVLEVDNSEYALLTAVCIFSERPGLTYIEQVERVQDIYMDTLSVYIKHRRKGRRNALARLLIMLVHLRTLGSRHSEVLQSLKLRKGSLPPLLGEYFDIFD